MSEWEMCVWHLFCVEACRLSRFARSVVRSAGWSVGIWHVDGTHHNYEFQRGARFVYRTHRPCSLVDGGIWKTARHRWHASGTSETRRKRFDGCAGQRKWQAKNRKEKEGNKSGKRKPKKSEAKHHCVCLKLFRLNKTYADGDAGKARTSHAEMDTINGFSAKLILHFTFYVLRFTMKVFPFPINAHVKVSRESCININWVSVIWAMRCLLTSTPEHTQTHTRCWIAAEIFPQLELVHKIKYTSFESEHRVYRRCELPACVCVGLCEHQKDWKSF